MSTIIDSSLSHVPYEVLAERALTIACPYIRCAATPGESCTIKGVGGVIRPARVLHVTRTNAARSIGQADDTTSHPRRVYLANRPR